MGAVDIDTGEKLDPWLPFILFPKQEEFVRWLEERSRYKQDGHCAKSRDVGFTWMCGAYALKRWLFEDGYKANFGSRKAEYVDRIGDPDSIFEKIRLLYRRLPPWMLPANMADNSSLIINEDRDCVLRGESGDQMGRGGRATDYFFDEFAFVERADGVDAASAANADTRIFGSTVNGTANLFYRMQAGERFRPAQKFRIHWKDDPRKAEGRIRLETGQIVSWEKATRLKMEAWKFASEYDIDYTASVEGICIPAKWVEAAKALRPLVHYVPPARGKAGGDVGGGGEGKSVAIARFGALVVAPRSWGHGDTIQTAKDMLQYCKDAPSLIPAVHARKDGYDFVVTALNYDSVGVGKGTQDAFKRTDVGKIVVSGVNVGQPATDTVWPDGEKSSDKFANLKAELWNRLAARFRKSYQKWLWLNGDRENPEAFDHPIDECIIVPAELPGETSVATLCSQLSSVKNESNEVGKTIMQSKKSMKKEGLSSPDHADALVLAEHDATGIEVWLRAGGVAA